MSDNKSKPWEWEGIMIPSGCDWEAAGMNRAPGIRYDACVRCANFRLHKCHKHGIVIATQAEQERFSCRDWVENRQAKPKPVEMSQLRPGQPLMMGTAEYEQHDVAPGYQVVSPKQEAAIAKPNQGKPQYHYLDPLFMAEIAKVLEFGAQKYEAWNWTKGYPYSTIYDSCQRHLTAWWMGEDCDPESGISHLAHAGCNLMFLARFHLARPDSCSGAEDDRPAMLLPELLEFDRSKRFVKGVAPLLCNQDAAIIYGPINSDERTSFIHRINLWHDDHQLMKTEKEMMEAFAGAHPLFAANALAAMIHYNGEWGSLEAVDAAREVGKDFESAYKEALRIATAEKERENK